MEVVKLNVGGVNIEVPKESISQGLEKGEIIIETTDLVIKPKTEFETYLSNLKKEEYNNGKVAGSEMTIKEAREKYGLSFEGKTIDNFAEALKAKVIADAKIEPTQKIKELENDKEKLQAIAKEWETKHNDLLSTFENEKKQGRIERELLSKLPKDGLAIPSEDLLLILKTKNEFDVDGNSIVVKKGGEVLKNQNTLNPITLDEYLPEIIKPYIIKRNGGNGEESGGSAKAGTIEAFIKEMSANNITQGSQAFNAEMQKRIKDGTLKV
mgnify:CR=1 FL=1